MREALIPVDTIEMKGTTYYIVRSFVVSVF